MVTTVVLLSVAGVVLVVVLRGLLVWLGPPDLRDDDADRE